MNSRMNKHRDNNNEYLEHLTRTGPKRLHVLLQVHIVKIQCKQHDCTHTHANTHTDSHTHARTHTRTHTHTHTHTQRLAHARTHVHLTTTRLVHTLGLKKRTGRDQETEAGRRTLPVVFTAGHSSCCPQMLPSTFSLCPRERLVGHFIWALIERSLCR